MSQAGLWKRNSEERGSGIPESRISFFANGFTLIEIMLVLTLITILSSIAMPSLRGFAVSSRLKSSSHAIRDLLLFARDMAVTERIGYLVVFDLDRNRYWLASSETFDPQDPSTSSLSSQSSTVFQSQSQALQSQSAETQNQSPTVSRTSMILGMPQELSYNVSFAQMMTRRASQSRQVDTGLDYVYFSPSGSAEDVVVYIQDRKGKAMSISVEAATGRVRNQNIADDESEMLGLSNERMRE